MRPDSRERGQLAGEGEVASRILPWRFLVPLAAVAVKSL